MKESKKFVEFIDKICCDVVIAFCGEDAVKGILGSSKDAVEL